MHLIELDRVAGNIMTLLGRGKWMDFCSSLGRYLAHTLTPKAILMPIIFK